MADIRVPTLGESVTEATVATWIKKAGDAVKVDEMLCELETDKVTLEVPATTAGTLSEIVAKEGETVGVDALLGTIDEKAGAKPAAPAKAAKPARQVEELPGKAAHTDAESAPANEQSIEILVPALGESVTEATVSNWTKKPGDAVNKDEMLVELETDKVAVEVAGARERHPRRNLRQGRRHRHRRRQARPHRRRRRRSGAATVAAVGTAAAAAPAPTAVRGDVEARPRPPS